MQTIASLGVRLNINSAEFKAGLDDATKSLRAFENNAKKSMREANAAAKEFSAMLTKIGVVATAASLAIGKALSWADEISDTADAFDLTIASLLRVNNALALAGGKAENTATMFQKLAVNATQAAQGADDARDKFTKLGIAGADVEKLAPDQLFARVAEALAQIDDPLKRNALAFEMLGKAAKGVDWKEYWKNYGDGKNTSDTVTTAIQEGAKAWDNLGKAGKAALEAILVLILPFTSFINNMMETINAIKRGEGVDVDWGAAMGGMPGQEGGTISYKGTGKPKPAALPKSTEGYAKASDREQAEASAAEAVRQQTKEYFRQIEAAIKRQEVETDLAKMTEKQREMAIAVNKIMEERTRLLQENEKEIAVEEAKGDKANRKKLQALEEQREAIEVGKRGELLAITAIIQARQEEQNTFEYGWNKAFRQYTEDAQNMSKLGETAFLSVVTNMDRALSDFIKTGKLNFKGFAQSIIQDLIAIQLKAQATKLFKSAWGGLSDMIFGKASFDYAGEFGSNPFGLAADGGYIDRPTIVGENGPELFVPRTAGTVIPNQQLSSQMGSQPQVIYNGPYIAQMSAIDTQSATQFLAANKQAVWAANQSASRGIPTSR